MLFCPINTPVLPNSNILHKENHTPFSQSSNLRTQTLEAQSVAIAKKYVQRNIPNNKMHTLESEAAYNIKKLEAPCRGRAMFVNNGGNQSCVRAKRVHACQESLKAPLVVKRMGVHACIGFQSEC